MTYFSHQFSVRKKEQWRACDSWNPISVTWQHWKLWAMLRAPSPIWNDGSYSLFGCNDVYGTGIHTNLLSFPFSSNYMSLFFHGGLLPVAHFYSYYFISSLPFQDGTTMGFTEAR